MNEPALTASGPATLERPEREAELTLCERVDDCNAEALELLGYGRDELAGAAVASLFPSSQPDGSPSQSGFERRRAALQAGLPQCFLWRLRRRDGAVVDALARLDQHPQRVGCVTLRLRELPSLTRADRALDASESRLRQVLENTTAVVFIKDGAGRYSYVNRRFCETFGRSERELIGGYDADIFPAEVVARLRNDDRRVLEQGTAIEIEEDLVVDGRPCIYAATKFPLFDEQGRAYAVCGIATDVTRRKRGEEALRSAALAVSTAEGEALYQELTRYLATTLGVECCFIAECTDSESTRVRTLAVYTESGYEDNIEYGLPGTACGTVVGQDFRLVPSGVRRLYPEDPMFKRLGIEGYAAYPLSDSRGRALGLIAVLSQRPLTDRELTESMLKIFAARAAAEIERTHASEALRNSEEQYRTIFNASLDAMVMWSAAAGVVDVNPAFVVMHGCSRDDVLERDPSIFVPPESMETYSALLAEVGAGRPFRSETRAQRKDGSRFFVEMHGAPVSYKGKPHVLAMLRDISERKQREEALRRSEEQLRQAQKLEAIGHLTGGIAHDFNNILTSILGYIVLAAERPASLEDAKVGKYLDQARLASTRARDLIQQMLTFSRGQRGEPRALWLPPLIGETVKLLRSTLPSTVEIETELDGETPAVLLDPVHVEQVLMNLCINARDAMQAAGIIRVSVRCVQAVDCICASCGQRVQAQRLVELGVRDTGPGIPPEVLERMFEPFFSTKEVGKGSGMGLATVHGIVHEYGGHVVVDTAPGQGTELRVLFNALTQGEVPAKKRSRARSSPQKTVGLTGRVLVVEDEHMVADFMGELLKTWGLAVTVKTNPLEAIELLASGRHRFDLLITDQTMPKLTGLELACKATALHPLLPVILYTGYGEDLAQEELARCGVCALVKKPLEPAVLMNALRAYLPASRRQPGAEGRGPKSSAA